MSNPNLNFLLGGSWRNKVRNISDPSIIITVPDENKGGPYPTRTWFRGSLNCSTCLLYTSPSPRD